MWGRTWQQRAKNNHDLDDNVLHLNQTFAAGRWTTAMWHMRETDTGWDIRDVGRGKKIAPGALLKFTPSADCQKRMRKAPVHRQQRLTKDAPPVLKRSDRKARPSVKRNSEKTLRAIRQADFSIFAGPLACVHSAHKKFMENNSNILNFRHCVDVSNEWSGMRARTPKCDVRPSGGLENVLASLFSAGEV